LPAADKVVRDSSVGSVQSTERQLGGRCEISLGACRFHPDWLQGFHECEKDDLAGFLRLVLDDRVALEQASTSGI